MKKIFISFLFLFLSLNLSFAQTISSGASCFITGGTITCGSSSLTPGSGSVTNVSVTTQNGVSAVVTNPTTTPALAFILGAIGPTTISTNTISATNVSISGGFFQNSGQVHAWNSDVNISRSSSGQLQIGTGVAPGRGGILNLTDVNASGSMWLDTNGAALFFGTAASTSLIYGGAAGKLQLSGTTPMLVMGGVTSSFPSIKRSSAAIVIRLADDSADTDLYGATISANNVTATGTIKTGGYTVATLPTPQVAGRKAYVIDQTAACAAAGAALTGGGAVVCPVFDNGTAWVGG